MAQLAAFTQSLTAQQIVKAADQEAGNPGAYLNTAGTEDLTAPSYVKLQALLDDLALTGDWPFREDVYTLSVSSRSTGLPPDYWQLGPSSAFWVDPLTNARTPVRVLPREDWHANVLPSEYGRGVPTSLFIGKNQGAAGGGTPAGVVMVNPAPITSGLLELHYPPLPVALAAITSKPWFPYSLYLIKAVATELLIAQDDQRAVGVAQERERLFSRIRLSLSDGGSRQRTIKLNPDLYRPPLRI